MTRSSGPRSDEPRAKTPPRRGPRRDGATRAVAAPSAGAPSPGVVAVDATGRLTHRTEDAARHLDDLAAATPALTRLLRRHARRVATAVERDPAPGAAPLPPSTASRPAVVRARGRSGRWYALHAVVAEPDAWRATSAVVVIAPTTHADDATVDPRYGLSPRERAVLLRVARGESTKQIAAALGLSPFTVQDYVRRACEKVGVRTRRELVGKIFVRG